MHFQQLGLQLYTVREQTASDLLGTLRYVAEMGYPAVEFAGYGGLDPAQIRSALDEYGLRAIAAHVSLRDFEQRLDQVISDAQTLGYDYVVVPSVPESERTGSAAVQRLAQALNRFGAQCQRAGLRLAYHNHDFEFAPQSDSTMFDWLVSNTDPQLVGFELDVYWVQYAGVDPLATIRRLSGRMPLLHVKDMAADETRADVPVGSGSMDWSAILEAAEASGAEWYIVEQDHPKDALRDIDQSLRYLKQLSNA